MIPDALSICSATKLCGKVSMLRAVEPWYTTLTLPDPHVDTSFALFAPGARVEGMEAESCSGAVYLCAADRAT